MAIHAYATNIDTVLEIKLLPFAQCNTDLLPLHQILTYWDDEDDDDISKWEQKLGMFFKLLVFMDNDNESWNE